MYNILVCDDEKDIVAALKIYLSGSEYHVLETYDGQSALNILEKLPRDDKVNYLLAIVYSRRGDERSAVECYIRSCQQNPSMIHRGNLDPEISQLIRQYGLNQEPSEP